VIERTPEVNATIQPKETAAPPNVGLFVFVAKEYIKFLRGEERA
jgi:hypothetical protein